MDQPKTDSPAVQKPDLEPLLPSESIQRAAGHYQQESKAGEYAARISGTGTDRREKKCILKSIEIAKIPAGSSVLDCPCGPGRLIPILKKCGFKVTGADISVSMIDLARDYAGPAGQNCLNEKDNLCVANLFDTGFKSGRFDAVICHRIFHYLSQPQERILALTELHRISEGPVILSFLCNWSVDALWYKILRVFRLTRLRKCKPISPFTFAKDIRAAGFKIKSWLAMRPFASKRWYAILEPASTPAVGFHNSISAYNRIILAAGTRIVTCLLAVLLPLLAYDFIANSEPSHFRQVKDIAMKYQDGDDIFYVTNSSGLGADDLADKNIKLTQISQISDDITSDEKNAKDPFFLLSSEEIKKLQSFPAVAKLEFVGRVRLGTKQFFLLRTLDFD